MMHDDINFRAEPVWSNLLCDLLLNLSCQVPGLSLLLCHCPQLGPHLRIFLDTQSSHRVFHDQSRLVHDFECNVITEWIRH